MKVKQRTDRIFGWTKALLVLASIGLATPVLAAAAAVDLGEVTFTKDIAPILQRSCQQCHRANGVGPMPLETYKQARQYARLIKQRVETSQKSVDFIEGELDRLATRIEEVESRVAAVKSANPNKLS